ncbi:uncharacterized protein MONBRDRAFT_28055 [Monosiga brevicollis MX1]|uniref:WW domain-containing protein n=1 Tax=Monosiga brevicollis TaxID=81824 RepID=A9V724_MONBE|nr:uncharacterized protein MONBRDRAFT_28055 [Monosiga brevicollis MX1]EDQ86646.1 predicted protein [Monosiga brevicollis MX1]|eukprot:XP_001748482.1 hypothetical protein [Monosiga brevicollis MX1]
MATSPLPLGQGAWSSLPAPSSLVRHGIPKLILHHPVPANLPHGWDCRVAPDGHVFYVDHVNKVTQWSPPGVTSQVASATASTPTLSSFKSQDPTTISATAHTLPEPDPFAPLSLEAASHKKNGYQAQKAPSPHHGKLDTSLPQDPFDFEPQLATAHLPSRRFLSPTNVMDLVSPQTMDAIERYAVSLRALEPPCQDVEYDFDPIDLPLSSRAARQVSPTGQTAILYQYTMPVQAKPSKAPATRRFLSLSMPTSPMLEAQSCATHQTPSPAQHPRHSKSLDIVKAANCKAPTPTPSRIKPDVFAFDDLPLASAAASPVPSSCELTAQNDPLANLGTPPPTSTKVTRVPPSSRRHLVSSPHEGGSREQHLLQRRLGCKRPSLSAESMFDPFDASLMETKAITPSKSARSHCVGALSFMEATPSRPTGQLHPGLPNSLSPHTRMLRSAIPPSPIGLSTAPRRLASAKRSLLA